MTFLPKVSMALNRMTGETKIADTELILHSLNLLHMRYCTPEMYLFLSIIVQMSDDHKDRQSLLVHTRTVLFGLLGKHNKT
jgi:hypothetical protein